MSFEFEPDESVRKGVRRIARKQLEAALGLLTGAQPASPDEVVHEARKHFKKLRAVLRLVRPAIGPKAYRGENITFRDAARPLTEVRDAKVLVETVDGLAERFRDQVAGRTFADVRRELAADL